MGGTRGGVPPAGPGRGTPDLDLAGVPPLGVAESSPDRPVSKHSLPSYYVRGR